MNDRRDIAIRQFVASGLVLFALLFVVGHCSGCNRLTPAEQAQVASDGVKLSMCGAKAHMCKLATGDGGFGPCWDEFDACLVAHGFADAGAEGGR